MKHIKAFLLRQKVKLINICCRITGSKYRAGLLNRGYPTNVVAQREIEINK